MELPRRRGHFMLFRARRAGCRRVTRSTPRSSGHGYPPNRGNSSRPVGRCCGSRSVALLSKALPRDPGRAATEPAAEVSQGFSGDRQPNVLPPSSSSPGAMLCTALNFRNGACPGWIDEGYGAMVEGLRGRSLPVSRWSPVARFWHWLYRRCRSRSSRRWRIDLSGPMRSSFPFTPIADRIYTTLGIGSSPAPRCMAGSSSTLGPPDLSAAGSPASPTPFECFRSRRGACRCKAVAQACLSRSTSAGGFRASEAETGGRAGIQSFSRRASPALLPLARTMTRWRSSSASTGCSRAVSRLESGRCSF